MFQPVRWRCAARPPRLRRVWCQAARWIGGRRPGLGGYNCRRWRIPAGRALCAAGMLVALWGAAGAAWADTSAVDTGILRCEEVTLQSSAQASVTVDMPETVLAGSNVRFPGTVTARLALPTAVVRMSVQAAGSEALVGEGTLTLALDRGEAPFAFEWNAAQAAAGPYVANFVLRSGGEVLAHCTLPFRKLSPGSVAADMMKTGEELGRVSDLLMAMAGADAPLDMARIRLELAEESLSRARHMHGEGNWKAAAPYVEYAAATAESVVARLVFWGGPPGTDELSARPPVSNLSIREGGYFADGRPVFLFGISGGVDLAPALGTYGRLGLDLATVQVPPHTDSQALAAFVASAEDAGMRVVAQLQPERLEGGAHALAVDLPGGDRNDGVRRYLQDQLTVLQGQPAVLAVALAHDPEFHFHGDEVESRFEQYVSGVYPNRDALNRAWKSRYRAYDEVTVNWDYRPAPYRYDLATFHQGLIDQYLSALLGGSAQGGMPLSLTVSDAVLTPETLRRRADIEYVADRVPVVCVSALASPQDPVYGLGFPQHTMLYALMQSLAPEKPLVSVHTDLFASPPDAQTRVFDYVYASLWLSAVSGVDAVAVPGSGVFADSPEALDALVSAQYDINRLAAQVHAMQRQPAEIGILWSPAATVFEQGETYLASLRMAYEGSQFGGRTVRFISENQAWAGALHDIDILVLPYTLTVHDATFEAIQQFLASGGFLIRSGSSIPYNERGLSRGDVISYTEKTVLVRGGESATKYLHALDAAYAQEDLATVPRPVNEYGYPLEGVLSRYFEHNGAPHFFVANLRKAPVQVFVTAGTVEGWDLIDRTRVTFPRVLEPLDVQLVRVDSQGAGGPSGPAGSVPVAVVNQASNPR